MKTLTTLAALLLGTTAALAGQPVYNPQVAGVTCELKPIEGSNAMQRVDPTCGTVLASKNYRYEPILDEEGNQIGTERIADGHDNGG